MSDRIRVGGVVYGPGKVVVARFTHGAWYRERLAVNNLVDMEPLDPEQAKACEAMPDATTLEMSDGEAAILAAATQALDNTVTLGPGRKQFLAALQAGIESGLRKHGPFDPSRDTRDLVGKCMTHLRDAGVYACMAMAAKGVSGKDVTALREVVVHASRLWNVLRWAQVRATVSSKLAAKARKHER